MIDREAVRSNAKYLRQVRPIDPEEIADYVPDRPHPAVVRETLREEALDLGLVERADGTFVPVDDDPIPVRGWEPEAFPDRYAFALEDLLVERYGADWHRGASGRRLREAIVRLKTDYFAGNAVAYDETAAMGYALYHLPDYYATVGYVLDALAENGHLDRRLRVLDVGAGVGGPALGLHDYLYGVGDGADPLAATVEYHAVEPSAAADVLERLLAETTRNFRPTIHRTTIEAFGYDTALGDGASLGDEAVEDGNGAVDTFDLVVFGNVLSELDDPAGVVADALAHLAADGTTLALEPADLSTATGLRAVERAVVADAGATVYAPTLRLWAGREPASRSWSFDVRPDLSVPGFQRRLDEAQSADDAESEPGTFLNVDVQFAYSLLRTDGARRYPFRASRERHAPMATMDERVTERIDLLAVKLSGDLSDGGNPLFLVSDGSQQVDHYAVLTRESALNRDLRAAPYGAVLGFENVLVLWNDDEGAYNLVVDGETVVESLSGY